MPALKDIPDTLPKKPSALLRVALADLRKCERSKRFTISMDDWYVGNGTCTVCFAGSVMAQSCELPQPGGDDYGRFNPSDFRRSIEKKFYALNAFRLGMVYSALHHLDGRRKSVPGGIGNFIEVADYHEDPTKFKRQMRQLADDLEAAGL